MVFSGVVTIGNPKLRGGDLGFQEGTNRKCVS